MSLLLAANYYATRAHWTEHMSGVPAGGQRGLALCSSERNQVDVYDQVALDDSMFKGVAKRIETLPLCKRCARKAEALGVAPKGDTQ